LDEENPGLPSRLSSWNVRQPNDPAQVSFADPQERRGFMESQDGHLFPSVVLRIS
jgi:hypothetical protein